MKYTIQTDVGVVRKENQDRAAVFVGDNVTFAILCDGMGGHLGGSYAASLTIETFEREFKKVQPDYRNFSSWFSSTLAKSVNAMRKQASEDQKLLDMGTTLTAAAIYDTKIVIYNIGDSRTYIYNGLLHQITEDQNLRNFYIEKHHYTEDEAAQIVGAAALTSALGPTKTTSVKAYEIDQNVKAKYIVLTSDGIHDYIPKPIFEQILSSKDSIEEKGLNLIERAIEGRSSDNLTCVIVDLGDGA